jgi:restriction endonuclease S subunit
MIVKSRSNYDSPKIVIVKTGASFVAAVDDDSLITLQSVYNLRPKGAVPCKLGCALLNSRLLNAYLRWKVTGQKKLFPQITQGNVLEMPVPDVPMEKQRAIVDLVDRILAAKAADPGADTAAWEREIDERVYRLYGLTEEEVKIVEESAR